MTIRLDLSFLNGDLRSIIVNSEEIKSFSIDRSADVDYTITTNRTTFTVTHQHYPKIIITLDYKKESLEDFKVILRDILARNHLDNFTIAEDIEAENTVAILREGDLEQFGIYVCKHCGTTFKSIDERIIHERITGKTMAQSGFTSYDNKYFTMAYPSGWTVNDTGLDRDLSICCDPYHGAVEFTTPNHDGIISLEIYGPIHPPLTCCATLDKNYLLDKFSYGNVISIDNQTQYMSGKQAAVVTLIRCRGTKI